MITEDFLYYIWQNRLLSSSNLKLLTGEGIEILHPGHRNFESGPDYFNARIRIDGMTWAGNIEIHVKASDWFKHHHDADFSYDNIILHVVEIADAVVKRSDGSDIPVLVMQHQYPKGYLEHYFDLMQSAAPFVPCSRHLHSVQAIHRSSCLGRMLTERLESRFEDLSAIHALQNKRWPDSLYLLLARSFGFKTNAVPFELLAKLVPFTILARHRQSAEELEAIFFGQAGLIPSQSEEAYPERLKKKYRFFKHKYILQGMSPHLWKFGGLRPANFPTLRISQFVALNTGQDFLIDRIIAAKEISDLSSILDISASDYWYQHYRFGVASESYAKRLGKESILTLVINAIIPFLFFYGRKQQLNMLCDKALYWMEKCRPENNRIIRGWQDAGWVVNNAGETQALLHLKKQYCDYKKCVNCSIGQHLICETCKT